MSCSLTITGIWKGTNNLNIRSAMNSAGNLELVVAGLEVFYKIANNLSPRYLKDPIPPIKTHLFDSPIKTHLFDSPIKTHLFDSRFSNS